MISFIEARRLLNYDSRTGVFTWAIRRNQYAERGDVAGTISRTGYVVINIGHKRYQAHRLAWLMTYGVWPAKDLDHKDRNRTNNRIKNLREATRAQNNLNVGLHPNNKSGIRGVSRFGKKWRATITVKGKHKHLGLFTNKQIAKSVYTREYNNLLKPILTGVHRG